MSATIAIDSPVPVTLAVQKRLKRFIDLLLASSALLLFSPLFALIAALILLETGGKVIYRQERSGLSGGRFTLYKFRTMQDKSDEQLAQVLQGDPQIRSEFEHYHKLQNDPRVTHFGQILRKASLDELPQLFNVLRGEMSLVGPRPCLPGQIPLYGSAAGVIFTMMPGLTGLWQVSGRNNLSFEDRVCLDEQYARKWSLWLDLKILLQTPWVVLTQKGAY